jgi:hypothetical protein
MFGGFAADKKRLRQSAFIGGFFPMPSPFYGRTE